MARIKAFADKHLGRFISKKLLVWLTTTVLLIAEKLDAENWVTITVAYVGTQGFVDTIAKYKNLEGK